MEKTDEVEVNMHWADQTARKILELHPDKQTLVCASGITPSGTVHIGNFREIITVELVVRALRQLLAGTKRTVKFIYSWDDYDVFRKVPLNMPNQEMLKKQLRKPIVDIPDPFGEEESYARYHEVQIEKMMPALGIYPEYLYQAKKYRACEYADPMKVALENSKAIKTILDKYRETPLEDTFVPIRIFCEKCNLDEVEDITYKGGYEVSYTCTCGHSDTFDIRKKGIAKLQWRVDWPMRWNYQQVDFEPGGKDHSSPGGSFDTGKLIVKEVFHYDAPYYIMYDFVLIKGLPGKISSSKGQVLTIADVLEAYEPAMVRWMFASPRIGSEFAISFDNDVIKLYEDFDKCERVYYGTEALSSEKETNKQKRIYELSCLNSDEIPAEPVFQPAFRHLTTVVQVFEHNIDRVVAFYKKEHNLTTSVDLDRLKTRAICASNWLKKYAGPDMIFSVNENVSSYEITSAIQIAVDKLIELLDTKKSAEEIGIEIYNFCKEKEIPVQDFFATCYQLLISKPKGPKLIPFIMTLGKERAVKLLKKLS